MLIRAKYPNLPRMFSVKFYVFITPIRTLAFLLIQTYKIGRKTGMSQNRVTKDTVRLRNLTSLKQIITIFSCFVETEMAKYLLYQAMLSRSLDLPDYKTWG